MHAHKSIVFSSTKSKKQISCCYYQMKLCNTKKYQINFNFNWFTLSVVAFFLFYFAFSNTSFTKIVNGKKGGEIKSNNASYAVHHIEDLITKRKMKNCWNELVNSLFIVDDFWLMCFAIYFWCLLLFAVCCRNK